MRARNIKPGFFKNEDLAECKPLARLLFIGLWCMAYREGVVEYRPKKIKAEIFPYEDGKCNIEELLEQLKKFQLITILEHPTQKHRIIYIPTFTEHQSPHRNEKSCGISDLGSYREITGNYEKLPSPLLNDERGMMNDERGMMSYSPEPKNDSEQKAVLKIPLISKDGFFDVMPEDVAGWSETFVGVDVAQQLKELKQWNIDNPTRRKTKNGIRKHIFSWLAKEQNRSKGNHGSKVHDMFAGVI